MGGHYMKAAIDLGTTNSLVMIRRNGKNELVPNQFGEYSTPSIVTVTEDEVFVGEMAYAKEVLYPQSTFRLFKRDMGSNQTFGERKITAIELSAMVIKQLIKDVEAFTNERVTEVVISVPAYFTDEQRQATRKSALICGVEANRIINEPSAAALSYYQIDKKEGQFLVFDFGGGTLDATVVDIFDDIVDIVAIAGNNQLGGHDLDMIIEDAFIECHPVLANISSDSKKILRSKMEKAKIALTTFPEVSIDFKYENTNYNMKLTQQDYINKSEPILMKIRKVVAQVLRDAEIKAEDIDDVICVGGSCKSIIIQNYLEDLLNQRINLMPNPDKVVIDGLGLMVAIINREPGYGNTILTDVCPFSLGVDVVGDIYSPIISRNTTLPVSRTRHYVTINDYQRVVRFSVYQGENLVASANKLLMSGEAPVIMKKKGAASVTVTFTYDINGILDVAITGDDVKKEYHNQVVTNKIITDQEVARMMPYLKLIDKSESSNREILLESRFERLNMELMSQSQERLRDLFMTFREEKEGASKGKLIQLINKVNNQLDDLERSIFDPFVKENNRH